MGLIARSIASYQERTDSGGILSRITVQFLQNNDTRKLETNARNANRPDLVRFRLGMSKFLLKDAVVAKMGPDATNPHYLTVEYHCRKIEIK